MYKPSQIIKLLLVSVLFFSLNSCGAKKIFKKVDAQKTPINALERAKKNVAEGRGASIKKLTEGRKGTNYEFSTSNPMWRASLETLDFLPLSNVDYSGGVIITDWYNDSSSQDESIKITIRFLSNEIQSNSIKIIIHKKECKANNNCLVTKIKSKIEVELARTILSKAAVIERETKK
jgi:hypothetical protein